MKILITGATGFIGSHLTKELHRQGYPCRCLVRNIKKATKIFKDYEDIEFMVGDITKPETLSGIEKNIDFVFHLAAHGHVAANSKKVYNEFLRTNVDGTNNLIKHCLKGQIKKFIHFSSTAAVGLIPDVIVDENTKPNPQTPYQKSKLKSEKVVKKYMETENFPAIILRPCMVYGPGGYGEFYKFVKLVKIGIMPKIGFKKKLTPIVYIDDVIQACLKIMNTSIVEETYFICGEKSYPFDDIIKYIKKSLGSNKILVYVPNFIALLVGSLLEHFAMFSKRTPLATKKNIKSTLSNRVFSIEKAKVDFKYKPVIKLEKGCEETINYFKQNKEV